jgi:hypothetical protein
MPDVGDFRAMALVACKECGKQISDKAEVCPHCGLKTNFEQTRLPDASEKYWRISMLIGALVIAFLAFPNFRDWLLGDSLEQRISRGLENLSESSSKAGQLQATDVSIRQGQFFRNVVGSITNTSGYKFSYLTVKINLFDLNGRLIDSTVAAIQDFEPNQTWNFQAPILNNATASARVTEIDGL